MIAWLLGKLKSLFLLAAVGGPALAGYMYWDETRMRDVETRGADATARIEGATRVKRRRSATSYDVDLVWKDRGGAERRARRVAVSQVFAGEIIRDDRIVRDSVRIRYLADDPEAKPILVEDAGRQAEGDRELIWVGAGAGVIGIVGSLVLLLAGRRAKA